MIRLTNHDDQGNWSLKGVKWENLYEGAVIDEKTYERLYTALWRLKDYEDTGLDPDRIEELKEENDWIPVEERLPEKEYDTVLCVTDQNYYLVCVYNKEIGFRISDFLVEGEIVAWRPLPELYQPERRI